MSVCAAAAAPTPSRATARATPTRTAGPAIPARSSAGGRASGCSMRCGIGAFVTGGCRFLRLAPDARWPAFGDWRSSGSRVGSGPRRASFLGSWHVGCGSRGRASAPRPRS